MCHGMNARVYLLHTTADGAVTTVRLSAQQLTPGNDHRRVTTGIAAIDAVVSTMTTDAERNGARVIDVTYSRDADRSHLYRVTFDMSDYLASLAHPAAALA